MAKYVLTNDFEAVGDFYIAKQKVATNAFAVHIESDAIGTYEVLQNSDDAATRPASTDVFVQRTEIDRHFQGVVPVEVTIRTTVPVTYCSIIESE